MYLGMASTSPSTTALRDLYAKMLQTRIVDNCARRLYAQGHIDFVFSCRGHEAAQVGSAFCIEVGQDFTLPYYRDLGVVLTIGMTPYEVFRTYLLTHLHKQPSEDHSRRRWTAHDAPVHHWGYHKHNTITGPAPVATQLLHAAGIAFASKLRKAAVVTVAYCGDDAISDPDFQEGIRFAAQEQLPVIFIYEQCCSHMTPSDNIYTECPLSHLQKTELPEGLAYQCIDGSDIIAVYTAMQQAMHYAREGHGPTLLEMVVTHSRTEMKAQPEEASDSLHEKDHYTDPLVRSQRYLEQSDAWSEEWEAQLRARLTIEVERALQDALRDIINPDM
jgi:2-oxoisovalerate dehydrogenase E1 component alpha subunit